MFQRHVEEMQSSTPWFVKLHSYHCCEKHWNKTLTTSCQKLQHRYLWPSFTLTLFFHHSCCRGLITAKPGSLTLTSNCRLQETSRPVLARLCWRTFLCFEEWRAAGRSPHWLMCCYTAYKTSTSHEGQNRISINQELMELIKRIRSSIINHMY